RNLSEPGFGEDDDLLRASIALVSVAPAIRRTRHRARGYFRRRARSGRSVDSAHRFETAQRRVRGGSYDGRCHSRGTTRDCEINIMRPITAFRILVLCAASLALAACHTDPTTVNG